MGRFHSKCLFLVTFASISCIATSETAQTSLEEAPTVFRKISEGAVYCGLGTAFASAYLVARLGWKISLFTPWSSTLGNEWLLLNHLFSSASHHFFAQLFKTAPSSQASWQQNQALLSQIPASTDQEKQLLLFLEKRWLAKSTGFFPSVVDWICPCFGVFVQVNPETTSCYSRLPSLQLSQTYTNRMEAWKQSLPYDFPLILTRPANIQAYLPHCFDISSYEIETIQEINNSKVIIDLSSVFPENQAEWLPTWEKYKTSISKACEERHVNPDNIICIQRVEQESIGGIRVLSSPESHYRFLLDWISNFGLTANRVELDRWPILEQKSTTPILMESLSKEEFIAYINSKEWNSIHPQKNLMIQGTLKLLSSILSKDIPLNPTRLSVAQLSFARIKDQLSLLSQESLFFDTASCLELIHADLSSLLEIFHPFTPNDFAPIYQNLLTSIPPALKPLTSCGLHSSAMTSMAGIFKAVGKSPRILYGENTYFECILAAEKIANATPVETATENDWKEVDLILAQFNPALKRIDMQITEYKVEKIGESLHKALHQRTKPLTLALDCTIDLIDSPRIGQLLEEFQQEIESGALNIICFRSGLKFDLFGMDNYCGAPFYMVHNQDAKWSAFDALLTDPVLQTDRLSLNWFCLAYQNAAPYLEQYRTQIFDNTRSLLSKVPPRLFNPGVNYRIIPFEQGIDPAFVDIKIFGPFHQMKGAALVGGCLYLKCMEGGHPIFYRPSIGFYHPNFTMVFGEECTTIRLTLGLDPAQVDVLADCFELIDALNGAPREILAGKLEHNPLSSP